MNKFDEIYKDVMGRCEQINEVLDPMPMYMDSYNTRFVHGNVDKLVELGKLVYDKGDDPQIYVLAKSIQDTTNQNDKTMGWHPPEYGKFNTMDDSVLGSIDTAVNQNNAGGAVGGQSGGNATLQGQQTKSEPNKQSNAVKQNQQPPSPKNSSNQAVGGRNQSQQRGVAPQTTPTGGRTMPPPTGNNKQTSPPPTGNNKQIVKGGVPPRQIHRLGPSTIQKPISVRRPSPTGNNKQIVKGGVPSRQISRPTKTNPGGVGKPLRQQLRNRR